MGVASIKITQGALTDAPGRSVEGGVITVPCVTTNGDDTNIATWKYELIDKPRHSVLALGTYGVTASSSFTPDVGGGCYRVKLTTTDTNGVIATDIRNFAVAGPNGLYTPSFQPLLGVDYTKDEFNFGGQNRSWSYVLDKLCDGIASAVNGLTPNILTQTTLYISYATGNDTDTGLVGHPLKTWREYWRRMCAASAPFVAVTLVNVAQEVQFLDSCPDASDPVSRVMTIGTNASHTLLGGFDTVARSSTFTAWTSQAPATNVPNQATDSAIAVSWASSNLVGHPIVDTTTGNAIAWVAKDLGTKKARLSQFCAPFAVGQSNLTPPTLVNTQGNGNAYQVKPLIKITWGGDIINGLCTDAPGAVPGATTANVYMKQLWCILRQGIGPANDQAVITCDPACGWVAIECRFDNAIWARGGNLSWINCLNTFTETSAAAIGNVAAGVSNVDFGGWEAQQSGSFLINNHHMLCGATFLNSTRGGQFTVDGLALMDTAQIAAQDNATVFVSSATPAIWGDSTSNPTFAIEGGSKVLLAAPASAATCVTVPSANWTFGGGATTGYPWNPATHAYLAAVANTIANLAASPAGSIVDPVSGSMVGLWL